MDLQINWNYEDNLRQFSECMAIDFEEAEHFEDGSMELKVDFPGIGPISYSLPECNHVSFVESGSEHYVTMPIVFLETISLYCHAVFPKSEDGLDFSRSFRQVNMPEFAIKVCYKDRFEHAAEDNFYLRFRPTSYTRNEDGSGMCLFAVESFGSPTRALSSKLDRIDG